MICVDDLKRHCYPILVGVMVEYKEQVFIIGTKTHVQYSICHVSPQEKENLTKSWQPQTPKSTCSQLEKQQNNPIKQRDRVFGD